MAGKKEVEPLVRVTLNLFCSDYAVMQEVYDAIGAQVAIRRIIHAHVQRLHEGKGLLVTKEPSNV